MDKRKYLKDNWWMLVHLLFGTKKIGVNNRPVAGFDSIFAEKNVIMGLFKLPGRIKAMKYRACIGFVSKDSYKKLFAKKG